MTAKPFSGPIFKLLSIILLASLLLTSVSTTSAGAFGAYPRAAPNDSCPKSDGSDRLTVDDSIGNGATYGCLVSYSGFPIVTIRVYNEHGFWTKIAVFDNLSVIVSPQNVWARWGYIAPHGFAEYTLTFDSAFNSRIMFFVNAAQPEDGRMGAGVINVISKVLEAAGVYLDAVNAVGDLEFVVSALDDSHHLVLAGTYLQSFDFYHFATEFSAALGNDVELNIIGNIAAHFGKAISGTALKQIFTLAKIAFDLADIWETVKAAVTGSYAGSVMFVSRVQANPLPPQPNPTIPPISTSSPPSYNASFVSDVTIPDGTYVTPGQSLTKTWRMRNTGTSTWSPGYKLAFVSGEPMGAPATVDVPSAVPGQTGDGAHQGYWRLRNPQGTYFGDKVSILVKVASSNSGGHITVFDASPASPSSASTVHLVGRIKSFSDFRAMRFVMGNQVQEMTNLKQVGGELEISYDWNTASLPRGTHTVVFEVAKTGDLNWANPERQVKTYELLGTPASTNRPPDRPAVKSPYDWYLKDLGGAPASVELCAYPSNDPDGDAVQYWFEVKDQGGGVYTTSGWTSNPCWTQTYGATMTYSWRVKAGDGGAESDWSSETWHFSVAGGGVYIGSHSFFQQDTNEAHMCVFVTYDGILAPDVYAWINYAADNSESGDWRLLDHYGPNTTPDCMQPNYHGFWIRSPFYETGTHKIKVSAIKRDSGNSATIMTSLDIGYIRPPEPNPLAPSSQQNNGTWWNTPTINFQWSSALRAESYTLRASTNSNPWDDPSPVLEQVLDPGTTSYTHDFGGDYGQLYWSVRASNTAGAADSGPNVWFGIDQVDPACQVQALPATSYENVFQVTWSGADDSAGVRSYDVQYRDSSRDTWSDWLLNAPASKLYDLFTGQPGHTYYFRCRATDNASNTGSFPSNGDTFTKVDIAARPTAGWWDPAWAGKYNLTILNNMPAALLLVGYPVHLHLDSGTTPTAAQVYAASQSSPKCNDLRVVYSDTTELDRMVDRCDNAGIDIWFRTQVGIAGGISDNVAHQLYYGNPSASAPPADRNGVFYPVLDSNYLSAFDMREGSGSVLHDAMGGGDATIDSESIWVADDKFGSALLIPGDLTPEPRYAIYAGYKPQPTCSFTAEIWLKRTPGHDYGGGFLMSQENTNNTPSQWNFRIGGDNRLAFTVADPSGAYPTVEGNQYINAPTFFNSLHHLAVTFNCSGEVKFYIDGLLDATRYVGSGLRQVSAPLRIGYASYNNQRVAGMVRGAALYNGVRTEFPYGLFANITNEPSVAAGAPVNPPTAGNPDLAVLSLTTYPNPGGGVLVEAVVQNLGDAETQNGFYTDLYVNHVPTGSGDFTGSLQFWVNDPIGVNETVTLRTVITDLASLGLQTAKAADAGQASASFSESTATLYAQTDSAGSIQEPDDANNIYSAGTELCLASEDVFEDDNEYGAATPIVIGTPQIHDFDVPGDSDWMKFNATSGQSYLITTSALGIASDTYMYLYDTDGQTLLASNDDFGDSLASRILWTAPATGTYYVLVKHWSSNAGGCGTQYTVAAALNVPTSTISGNAGVAGATLSYTDGVLKTATADGSGNYSLTVSSGWSGTVTPSKTGCTFTPANRPYSNVTTDQAGQDYTATAITYTISGNAGVAGAILSYIDGTPKTATADGAGAYSLSVSYNWSGTVTPSKLGYTFSPTSRTYSNIVTDQTSQDYMATTATSFVDVPTDYWAWSWIERLYAAGITGGCAFNPLQYCPEDSVTRAQMAIFLERGIHGASFTPPTVTLTFNDTAGNFAQYWIEALKSDGITSGCGPTSYCPDASTTRAEMAIFLLRSKHGAGYVPPAATGTLFTDVPTSYWAARWIEQLANEGITSGCGTNLYCPDATVTRAQMAVFLVRTFNLP